MLQLDNGPHPRLDLTIEYDLGTLRTLCRSRTTLAGGATRFIGCGQSVFCGPHALLCFVKFDQESFYFCSHSVSKRFKPNGGFLSFRPCVTQACQRIRMLLLCFALACFLHHKIRLHTPIVARETDDIVMFVDAVNQGLFNACQGEFIGRKTEIGSVSLQTLYGHVPCLLGITALCLCPVQTSACSLQRLRRDRYGL